MATGTRRAMAVLGAMESISISVSSVSGREERAVYFPRSISIRTSLHIRLDLRPELSSSSELPHPLPHVLHRWANLLSRACPNPQPKSRDLRSLLTLVQTRTVPAPPGSCHHLSSERVCCFSPESRIRILNPTVSYSRGFRPGLVPRGTQVLNVYKPTPEVTLTSSGPHPSPTLKSSFNILSSPLLRLQMTTSVP